MYTNNLHVQEFILHCLIADLNEYRVVDLLIWNGTSPIFLDLDIS